MAYEQVLSPNTAVTSMAGMCLWFTEEAYGFKPHTGIASATDAFHASAKKHYDAHPTNVSVPIYLTHYGSYGTPAVYKDWGHYFLYVPGRGYLSSPITFLGPGQQWFKSIDEIVSAILRTAPNSKTKYVGWTEDIAGRVIVKEGKDMIDSSSTNSLRIIHSEIGGWDFGSAHSGSSDKLFHAAWDGRTFDELIYAQWAGSGSAFRAKRIEAIDYFDNKRPQLEAKVAELGKAIAIKDDEIKKLQAQLSVQSGDTELLNGFGAWLTKLIARLGLKG